MQRFFWILLFICSSTALAQVKVGDNINTIDGASILELESTTKALVVSRVTTAQMNAIEPLNGAMVYNTEEKCIFVFEGAAWKTLCDSDRSVLSQTVPPFNPIEGDIWLNETNGITTIWDGATWIPLSKNPRRGNGSPTDVAITDAVAGDIYVDTVSGDFYTYDGTDWIGQTIHADNGISQTADNTFELGGTLTHPTEITTDATQTLSISGLEEVSDNDDQLVTVEETTGRLRKRSFSSLVQQEEVVIIANDAQTQFTPPLAITSSKKLNVYRNGVKLGFTIIDDSTIELETPVVCYQNDEIRIVQFY